VHLDCCMCVGWVGFVCDTVCFFTSFWFSCACQWWTNANLVFSVVCVFLLWVPFFVVLGFLRFHCVCVCEVLAVSGPLSVACVSASDPQRVVPVCIWCSWCLCFWLGMFVDAICFCVGTGRLLFLHLLCFC